MTDRDLFIAALEHTDPDARGVWLTEACPDPEARRRVEILLKAHDQASRFLAVPVAEGLAAGVPTLTGHPTDDTATDPPVDVLAFLSPSDTPGHLGRVDHFEVLEVVGKGGMGVVLKALDPKLHRLVALKLMAPHLAASVAARKRFEREARAVAAVRNEHVVAIYDVAPNGPAPYLVMEFIGGMSLQDRLERSGPLEVKEVLRIGLQAARGLAAAHAQGLVHRDVKPANILLENGVERVKLTDFGLARAADDANLTQSGIIAGTPNYMSPEQANGSPVDARSDLFSLGSVLYALCAGHPPFRADTAMAVLKRVCDDTPRPLTEINADIPPWLDAIVRKLLAKKPGDRFRAANEVADLLGQHLAHLQNPTAAPIPVAVVIPLTHQAEPVWTEIFAGSDRPRRVMQLILLFAGCALIMGTGILLAAGRDTPILFAPGLGMVVVAGLIRRRWRVPYKGRTIRFEHSVFTGMQLFVDNVQIARDQVRRRVELRGTVPEGPGRGDEVRADAEAGLARITCRISVREAVRPAPISVPTPAAPELKFRIPERPPVVGCLIGVGLLAAFVAALVFRDALWETVFHDGFFAPIFLGFTTALLVFATWLMPKLPSPAGPDRKPRRVTLGLAFLAAAAGIVAGWIVWATHIGVRGKAVDAIHWGTLGLAGASLVINVPVLFRRRRPTDNPKAFRREWRTALLVVISFTPMVVTAVGRLVVGPESGDRPDGLVIKWNQAFVDRVTVERDGTTIDDFQGKESGVGYPYQPGEITVRGYLRGRQVYREVFHLDRKQESRVSVFDSRMSNEAPVLQVESDDLGHLALEFRVTSPDHDFTWTGPTSAAQQLVAGEAYQFQATRGTIVIHTETIRLKAGEIRSLRFPRIGPPGQTIDLKPMEGRFPADVVRMQFSPDRSLVAAARSDGPILVFDTATGRERYTIRRPQSDCTAFGFSPNGKLLAYVGRGEQVPQVVHLVSAADGQPVDTLVAGPERGLMNSHALAFSADGSRLAVATAINFGPNARFMSRVLRWELSAKKGASLELQPVEWVAGTITAILFAPDGETVRTISGTTQGTGWDWKTRAVHQSVNQDFEIDSLAPGTTADVAAGWNASTNTAVAWLWHHVVPATPFNEVARGPTRFGGMAITPEEKHVALGIKGVSGVPWEGQAAVFVYDTETKKPVIQFLGHTDWVMDVAFLPDNKGVISTSKDGTVRRWKLPE